jgi:ABC-2 type transport system ATP-binding protein
MIPALRTQGLGHRYGRRTWGLQDATLEVPPGRIVALVGPNGAGKTTLLHMAAGLLSPTAGTVEVIGDSPEKRLDRVGFVAQDAPLWPRLRVEDVLEIGRCMNPRFDSQLANDRIAHLDIPTGSRISSLSGGQRAQVALTLVLAKRPELLLLDEPLSNLDPLARREFLASMFETCSESGTAVLFSSHVVAELERICDYLILLRKGHVRLAGDIDELRQAHRVLSGPNGWMQDGAWQVISAQTVAGRTTALTAAEPTIAAGPGIQEALPTFDELVLGYLEEDAPTRVEVPA